MDDRLLISFFAAFLAAAPLVFGIGVRESVRHSRRNQVEEIHKFLDFATEDSHETEKIGEPPPVDKREPPPSGPSPIMALEFLKFKYDPARADFLPHAWLIAGLLLFTLLFVAMASSGLVLRSLLCTKLPQHALCFEV